ncbi:macrophage mannose receptor 1-like [Littorina saxatilis]|uniref:C-type lectin domain-containing protein n=1 Tax=Littorina saxatilis TaxID=31220 RepID=A0AAN9G138_9CAEN
MDKFGTVLVFGLILFCCVFCNDISIITWYRDDTYDDKLALKADAVTSLLVSSSRECARSCQMTSSCNGFFYHVITKCCLRQSMVHVSPSTGLAGTGWRYFRPSSQSCPKEDNYVVDRTTGTCYYLETRSEFRLSWMDARDACAARNQSLVSLETVAKATFISDFMNFNTDVPRSNYHIGAHRPYDTWNHSSYPASGPDFLWLSGQPIDLTMTAPFWKKNRPDNSDGDDNVVYLDDNDGFKWEDWREAKIFRYICERSFGESH